MINSAGNGPTVVCDGSQTNVSGLTGVALLDKIKEIARNKGISKFDVLDGSSRNLDGSDIERGNFTFPLNIVRYNVAAA